MASYDDLYKAALADRKAKALKKAETAKKRKKKKEVVKEGTPDTTE